MEKDLKNKQEKLIKKQNELWDEMKLWSWDKVNEYYMSNDPDRKDLTEKEYQELGDKFDKVQKELKEVTEKLRE